MQLLLALSSLLLFATCRAKAPGWELPSRPTTTTSPPTTTAAAFQPHGPIQTAIYDVGFSAQWELYKIAPVIG